MSKVPENDSDKELEGDFSDLGSIFNDDLIEDFCDDKLSIERPNIISIRLEFLPSETDVISSSSSLRTHFRKSEGNMLLVELLVDNSNQLHLWGSFTAEILLKDDTGRILSKSHFRDTVEKYSATFKIREWIDISDLPEGSYTLCLRQGTKQKDISEIKIVDLPFPYTEYTSLSGFVLLRINEGESNGDVEAAAARDPQNCFNYEDLEGILIALVCESELSKSYDYQLIVRVYNELGSVVFEDETHGRVEPKKKDSTDHYLSFQVGVTEAEWNKGNYRIEAELFGEVIVKADFVVGDRDVIATYNVKAIQPQTNTAGKAIITNVKDPMAQLNLMIGLTGVKNQIAKMVSKTKLDLRRKSMELPTKQIQMHCAFLGNPGTGKTTVAKLLGQIYKDLGLLSKGHVVLEERSTLMGQNWGSEGESVNKAIQKAQGGILFIDEAYDLVTNHPNDPGRLIISSLLSALADESQRDWMLILAGYPKPMEKMLNVNPGLRSRLKKFHFDDYNQEELMQITDFWLTQNCYTMSSDARTAFTSQVSTELSQRDEHFGNARYIFNLLENEIQPAMATRVMNEEAFNSQEALMTIKKCDIPNLNQESEGEKAIRKLNSMIGLSELKSKIEKHLSFVRFINARRDSNIFTIVPPMHMIFTGNPGTGKTSVADYLGEIYKSMGLLSVGNVIKVSRSDIIGNHTGDTEKNMQVLLSAARGNILFIDEAYTLYSTTDDFGKRAVEVLLDTLSRESLDMVVIMAGYPKEMEQLLCSNPGLKGRFPYVFHFEDYSEDELLQIAKGIAQKNHLILSPEAEDAVLAIIKRECRRKDINFSNARFVVRLVTTQIMPNMAHRIIASDKRDEASLKTIFAEDIPIKSQEVELINDNLFDEDAISKALEELDGLVGLDQVKRAVHEFVQVARKLNGKNKKLMGGYPLKWSFAGNTGTGKSTVAEILSELLKAMHLLGRGHIVEVKAEELYAVNTHQADEHLKKRMLESQQGLLFVDGDAAQFRNADSKYNPDYLRMCLAANTATMPGTYAVVIAEHESPRHGLVKSLAKSGITDFDHTLIFEDYTAEELLEILKIQLKGYEMTLNESASEVIKSYIDSLCANRNADYANARTMKLLARSIQKISLLNGDTDGIITAAEVAEFANTKIEKCRKPIGY